MIIIGFTDDPGIVLICLYIALYLILLVHFIMQSIFSNLHVVCKLVSKYKIKVPLLLLMDIESLLYTQVSVFIPDGPIRLNFKLHSNYNLHKDSHQNALTYPQVKGRN